MGKHAHDAGDKLMPDCEVLDLGPRIANLQVKCSLLLTKKSDVTDPAAESDGEFQQENNNPNPICPQNLNVSTEVHLRDYLEAPMWREGPKLRARGPNQERA